MLQNSDGSHLAEVALMIDLLVCQWLRLSMAAVQRIAG